MRPSPNVVQKCGKAPHDESPAVTFTAAPLTSPVGKAPVQATVGTTMAPPTGMNAPPLLIVPPLLVPALLVPPVGALPALLLPVPPLPPLVAEVPAALVLVAPPVATVLSLPEHALTANPSGIVRRPIVFERRKERTVDRPFIECFLS